MPAVASKKQWNSRPDSTGPHILESQRGFTPNRPNWQQKFQSREASFAAAKKKEWMETHLASKHCQGTKLSSTEKTQLVLWKMGSCFRKAPVKKERKKVKKIIAPLLGKLASLPLKERFWSSTRRSQAWRSSQRGRGSGTSSNRKPKEENASLGPNFMT